MSDKPEVHRVDIEDLPSTRQPAGRSSYGYYTVVDGMITMTGPDGEPATDGTGKLYTHQLAPGDADARAIAGKLTRELRLALKGESAVASNWRGPLPYKRGGWM